MPRCVEINPLIVTGDGRLVALDAKMTFDDNALYRHKEFKELRDLDEEEPLEVEASKFKLNYIKLDGNVGCMVNGAGLAMATMDIIKLSRRQPREFSRRRRRRVGRAGEERVPNPAQRSERAAPSSSIFSAEFCAATCSPAAWSNAAKELGFKVRSWCAWKAPTWSRARKFCAIRA